MSRILITSGPTRQYLDPVRYLTNASSGRMGSALAQAAIDAGHQVTIVSGPVNIDYAPQAELHRVISTEEMLSVCQSLFAAHDGMIGVAAPCDYRPVKVFEHKIHKNGEPLELNLIETADVVATLGAAKRRDQWVVGFALETEDVRLRALAKLEKKHCDLIVLNGTDAMDAVNNQVEILDPLGEVVAQSSGTKELVGREIFTVIQRRLIDRAN